MIMRFFKHVLIWAFVCPLFFVGCTSDKSSKQPSEVSQVGTDEARLLSLENRIEALRTLHFSSNWLWYLEIDEPVSLHDCLALMVNSAKPEELRIGAARILAYGAMADKLTKDSYGYLEHAVDDIFPLTINASDKLSAFFLVCWIELLHREHGSLEVVNKVEEKVDIESWPSSGDEYLLGAQLYTLARFGLMTPIKAENVYMKMYNGSRRLEVVREMSPVVRSLRHVVASTTEVDALPDEP